MMQWCWLRSSLIGHLVRALNLTALLGKDQANPVFSCHMSRGAEYVACKQGQLSESKYLIRLLSLVLV